jgi:hypothetical protein
MELNKRVRHTIANFLFLREYRVAKRTSHSVTFDEAKKIGILYDATSDKNYEIVKQFVKEIRAQQKDVLALGYVDKNELPNMRFAKLGLDFFTRKAVNWKMKPQHASVSNFINHDFDILINLHTEKCFPLKYISAMTKARFKIGKYDQKNFPFCDMMIEAKENIGLKDFIEQVTHYLKLLKNDNSLQKA